jgi:gas vesicle protein
MFAMFSRVRIAIRFFFVGLAVGVLLAPRSGEETRRMVRQKADRLLNDVLDAATLGTAQTDGGTDEELTRTEQVETPSKASRSNGGSSRSRKTAAASASASESTAGAGS